MQTRLLQYRKGFTLIELLIVIVIVGILSMLLFRTLADMISANARIQQEKIMTQELITLQTAINNISERYPIIDMERYKGNGDSSGLIGIAGFSDNLYLKNSSGENIRIYSTGGYLSMTKGSDANEIKITNPDRSLLSGIQFKLLPTIYYTTGSIYENLGLEDINAQGFWIFGNLSYKKSGPNKTKQTSSYSLQHFNHLKP